MEANKKARDADFHIAGHRDLNNSILPFIGRMVCCSVWVFTIKIKPHQAVVVLHFAPTGSAGG